MSRQRSNAIHKYLDTTDSAYTSLQQQEENHCGTKQIPYKTIAFILTFFIIGSVSILSIKIAYFCERNIFFKICIGFGILTTSGYFGEEFQDRALPSLLIGILMLIPGGYYLYILVNIISKREGFSVEDIPMF